MNPRRALYVSEFNAARAEPPVAAPASMPNYGSLAVRFWWYGIVMAGGFICHLIRPEGREAFLGLTLGLTVFVAIEVHNRARSNAAYWMLEPTVWASILTFGLVYGATNVVYFFPEDHLAQAGLLYQIVTPEMNRLMALSIIAAAAMWSGFYLKLGDGIGKFIRRLFAPLLRKQLRISLLWAVLFVFVSALARLLQISLGIFGYANEYQALLDYASIREYLDVAAGLGIVVLLAVSLAYFDTGRRYLLICMLALFAYEIAFSFLSGFKGRVLFPILVIGGAFIVVRRRFPVWLVPALVAALIIAWAVVEPFRMTKNTGSGIDSTSVGAISTALGEAAREAALGEEGGFTVDLVPILARSNITAVGSLGIAFVDEGIGLPPDAPSFLSDIFLAPAHALVPRFLWEDKPLQSLGLWYVREVLGFEYLTSVGMGPITYLYFAGGVMAVVMGFGLLGVAQRALIAGLFGAGGGAVFCYLLLMPTVVSIDSAFNTVFVGIIRYGLIAVLWQWLLLKR